jgi:hypothetical protein
MAVEIRSETDPKRTTAVRADGRTEPWTGPGRAGRRPPPSTAPFVALGILLSLLVADVLQLSVEPDAVPARGWTLLLVTGNIFLLSLVLTRVRSLLGSVLLASCAAPLLTYGVAQAQVTFLDTRGDLLTVWGRTTEAASGPLAASFIVRLLVFHEDRARPGSLIHAIDARAVWFAVVAVSGAAALFVSTLPVESSSPPRTYTLAIALLGVALSGWFTARSGLALLHVWRVGRRLRGMTSCNPETPATTTLDLGVGDEVFAARSAGSAYRTSLGERVLGSYSGARGVAGRHALVSVAVTAGLILQLLDRAPSLVTAALREDVPLLSGRGVWR